MSILKRNPNYHDALKERPDQTQVLLFCPIETAIAPSVQPTTSAPSAQQLTPILRQGKGKLRTFDTSDSESSSDRRSKRQKKKRAIQRAHKIKLLRNIYNQFGNILMVELLVVQHQPATPTKDGQLSHALTYPWKDR